MATEFNEKRYLCEECPCLNNDSDSPCGLGYNCEPRWSGQLDLCYTSSDCGLVRIEHRNGMFVRPELSDWTDINPRFWTDISPTELIEGIRKILENDRFKIEPGRIFES